MFFKKKIFYSLLLEKDYMLASHQLKSLKEIKNKIAGLYQIVCCLTTSFFLFSFNDFSSRFDTFFKYIMCIIMMAIGFFERFLSVHKKKICRSINIFFYLKI